MHDLVKLQRSKFRSLRRPGHRDPLRRRTRWAALLDFAQSWKPQAPKGKFPQHTTIFSDTIESAHGKTRLLMFQCLCPKILHPPSKNDYWIFVEQSEARGPHEDGDVKSPLQGSGGGGVGVRVWVRAGARVRIGVGVGGAGEGGAEGGGVEFVLPAADDKGGDAIVPTRGSTAAQPGVTGDLGLVVEAAGILEEAGGEGAEDGSPDASIAD